MAGRVDKQVDRWIDRYVDRTLDGFLADKMGDEELRQLKVMTRKGERLDAGTEQQLREQLGACRGRVGDVTWA
jgi:hypothetical protein